MDNEQPKPVPMLQDVVPADVREFIIDPDKILMYFCIGCGMVHVVRQEEIKYDA